MTLKSFSIHSLLVILVSSCSSSIPMAPPTPLPTPIPISNRDPVNPVSSSEECDIGSAIDWMKSQKITYAQSPRDEWRDCSGNFLRLSSRIASVCPNVQLVAPPGVSEYMVGGNNKRPGKAEARTTRGIAKWYDQKGMFVPVYYDATDISDAPANLQEVRNRIKPGSVLWFSFKKPLAANGKKALYNESTGMIGHMATIYSVKKDLDGNVVEWKMYHGERAGKDNNITTHWWDWPAKYTSRGQEYPPGGYWKQRIVGFSESLIPPATIVSSSK